jgi:hypothetical protein
MGNKGRAMAKKGRANKTLLLGFQLNLRPCASPHISPHPHPENPHVHKCSARKPKP